MIKEWHEIMNEINEGIKQAEADRCLLKDGVVVYHG